MNERKGDARPDPEPPGGGDALWREYRRTGGVETRDRIVENYMPLVRRMAERLSTRLDLVVDVNSLVAVGAFGLIHGVERCGCADGDGPAAFERECLPELESAMIEGIRRYRWAPRRDVTAETAGATAPTALASMEGE